MSPPSCHHFWAEQNKMSACVWVCEDDPVLPPPPPPRAPPTRTPATPTSSRHQHSQSSSFALPVGEWPHTTSLRLGGRHFRLTPPPTSPTPKNQQVKERSRLTGGGGGPDDDDDEGDDCRDDYNDNDDEIQSSPFINVPEGHLGDITVETKTI